MAARTFVLALCLLLVGGLAVLTVKVAIDDGVTVLVVISLLLLGLIGVGVFGALLDTRDE
jgi:hypothetical protein